MVPVKDEGSAMLTVSTEMASTMTSPEIERAVGSFVQEKTSWPVQLHDPDLTIHVLVDENGLFTWTRRVPGPGGLPVGVSGRAACLLSGGIDSPERERDPSRGRRRHRRALRAPCAAPCRPGTPGG